MIYQKVSELVQYLNEVKAYVVIKNFMTRNQPGY